MQEIKFRVWDGKKQMYYISDEYVSEALFKSKNSSTKMLYEQQRITLTNTDQTNSDPARDRYITVDEGLHFFEHAILGRTRPRVHPIATVSDNFTTPPTVSDNFTQEDPESRFYITADPMPSSWTEPAP